MKAILISIKPKYVADILNGIKTIEIRKDMPKCDLPIDVYIYCTKDKKYANLINRGGFLTGMVVAKFTLRKVEEIRSLMCGNFYHKDICLTTQELNDYLGHKGYGYAWHISKLEIFDRPKELSEFSPYQINEKRCENCPYYYDDYGEKGCSMQNNENRCALTKAPQSFCYIEVGE